MYDVIIIGAGVSGVGSGKRAVTLQNKSRCSEKEEDVCSGTSKANSGLVHAGYDALKVH